MRVSVQTLLFTTLLGLSGAALAGPGAEQYNEFLDSGVVYDDPEWQDYLTEVGERVLAVTPHADRQYTFVLLDQPIVNAFTTGDEYVFITRGILPYFNTEDELAAVIGHEIGHVVGKHRSRRTRNNVMGEVLGWIGVIATSSIAMKDLANTLGAAAGADYGRKHELESDAFAADWLVDAGYNPQAMVDAIQILRDNDLFQTDVVGRRAAYHGIFRSHPEHQKRIHELVKRVQYNIPDEVPEPEGDFLSMLDGLVFGDEAASGVVRDNKFFHAGLRVVIEFPEGWDVLNTANEVVGKAPNPADQVITVQRQAPPQEDQTPEEYVTETLKRDDVINGETFSVGEYPAYIADIEVPGGGKPRKIGVLAKTGHVYLFKGEIGVNEDPQAFTEKFRQTMASFRGMSAADLKEANSQRLRVVEARPGDTFQKLSRNAPISRHGEETLRVINGRHPHGEPRAGDLVKIVR